MLLRKQSDLEENTLEIIKEVVKQVGREFPDLAHAERFRENFPNRLATANILLPRESRGNHPVALMYRGMRGLVLVRIFLEDASIEVSIEKDTVALSSAPPSKSPFR